MSKIKLNDLKDFCRKVLVQEGMCEKNAAIVAEVLSETDAFGTNSHGTKNLLGYIDKVHAGGLDIGAEPEVILEGPSFASIDANKCFGMISSVKAMELACEKAEKTGIAIVTVKNSCHFGAAILALGRACAKMRESYDILAAEYLLIRKVGHILCDLAAFKRP